MRIWTTKHTAEGAIVQLRLADWRTLIGRAGALPDDERRLMLARLAERLPERSAGPVRLRLSTAELAMVAAVAEMGAAPEPVAPVEVAPPPDGRFVARVRG